MAMPIYLSGEIRYDTRGLPEGYDPHKLYEYRYATIVKNATGFESFLHKYIPFTIIRSFAIAIDPTYQFKVAPHAITPGNRTKYRVTASVLQNRTYTKTRSNLNWAQYPNFSGVSNCWSPYYGYTSANTPPQKGNLRSQEALVDYLKDTTSRTRLFGSEQGTLELFKSYINSPARTIRNGSKNQTIYPDSGGPLDPTCIAKGGSKNKTSGGYDYWTEWQGPYGSVLPKSVHNALRSSEITFAKALCQKHAISMLKGWSPFQRDYTLFRNLAELRDLPRSVMQLHDTLSNLRKLFVSLGTQPSLRKSIFDLQKTAKDIPNEYLSYHFGWKQTYRDLMDLLAAPQKIGKRYNFLILRAGKPTTFRVSRTFESAEKDVSGFEYDISGLEYGYPFTNSRIERTSELRLVVNATFDFPPINIPSFRFNDYLDRIGVRPRVTDVYNLIPWTWLVDWFTGFGNYVELIDNINHDSSLVNWGMISCQTDGRLITNFRSKSDFVTSNYVFGSGGTTTTTTVENRHTSVLNYKCQTRSDVATILDVKQTSVPSSLTTYQKSILGALLAQRTQSSGSRRFTPKS